MLTDVNLSNSLMIGQQFVQSVEFTELHQQPETQSQEVLVKARTFHFVQFEGLKEISQSLLTLVAPIMVPHHLE